MNFKGIHIAYESIIKGKEYDYDDALEFEGEYLNNKRI